METLILMVDTAAIFLVVLYSLRNQRRPDDTREFGPFRIKPAQRAPTPPPAVPPVTRRRIRGL